jgi:short-subunit dehydrogenase
MTHGTALITGASSGIGTEFARLAAADGYDLVLVARGQVQLERLAEELRERHRITVRVIAIDLSGPNAASNLYAELTPAGISVDVLVNNAGFAQYGLFWRNDMQTMLDMLQVNMVTLTHLCRLFMPAMIERGRGAVLNVASMAAFQPGPLMAAYYASKAYVLWLSEALANECKDTGVSVTALCPGPTRTRFEQRAGLDLSRLFKWVPVSDARSVASEGYRAMKRGKTLVIPGFMNRLAALGVQLAPRSAVAAVVRALQERVG